MPDVRVIAGKYRLVTKLSEGGMGSVWSAEHLELNCPAAVKLLDRSFADSPEALARFKREAQSAASLRSTNIVQILDFGLDDGVPYIAMELLRGQTLAQRLAEKGLLSPIETATILSQVARAVAWAHDMGIIHRDLKPGNIFLSDDAGQTVVKLLDFGIAKALTNSSMEASMTSTGVIMGTPQYMSPEQASGSKSVDHRTDIWSFGVIAYECVVGKRAFAADTLGSLTLAICSDPLPVPSRVAPVPKGFDEWFARCSHRDPGRRFLSIDEACDILRFVCGLEVHAALSVPKLHSESPPPVAAVGSSNARSGTGSSTDAPSIITLSSSLPRRRRVPKVALFVGLFVTGALLALLFRLGRGSAARATAAPAASAIASVGPPALSQPISDSRLSILSGADDVPLPQDLQKQPAARVEVAQRSLIDVAQDRAPSGRPSTTTTPSGSSSIAQTAPTPSPTASGAPPHDSATQSGPMTAGSALTKTVENTFGLKRTNAANGSP
jgi:eukaryotic-like serine/threonine-protein kinase